MTSRAIPLTLAILLVVSFVAVGWKATPAPTPEAVEFREIQIQFDRASGYPHEQVATASFLQPVHKADAAIKGYDLAFTEAQKSFHRAIVEIKEVKCEKKTVRLKVRFGLDRTGFFEDEFQGWVKILVIAKLHK